MWHWQSAGHCYRSDNTGWFTRVTQIIEWLDNAWQIQRDRPTAIRSVRSQTLKLLNEKLKEWSDSQVRLANQRHLPMSASSRQVGFSVLVYKMCKDRWKFETSWLCLLGIRLQLQKISYALQSRTKYVLHTPNKKHFPSLNCVLVLTCNHEWLSIKIIFLLIYEEKKNVFSTTTYVNILGVSSRKEAVSNMMTQLKSVTIYKWNINWTKQKPKKIKECLLKSVHAHLPLFSSIATIAFPVQRITLAGVAYNGTWFLNL